MKKDKLTIKFKFDYNKLPQFPRMEDQLKEMMGDDMPEMDFKMFSSFKFKTYVIGVTGVPNIKVLPKSFIDYDTMFTSKNIGVGKYKLKEDQPYLLITLFTADDKFQSMGEVWTTLREWTPENEKKYKGMLWQEVEIEIENL